MKKEPTPNNPYPYCLCGCAAENNPGSRFKPGHDARLKSKLDQVKSGKLGADAIPYEVIEAARNDPAFKVVGYTAEEILKLAGDRAAIEDWGMQRGEIWRVSSPEQSGSGAGHLEIVLVIQDNRINSGQISTVTVVAVTSDLNLDETEGQVFLGIGKSGLSKNSAVNVSQIHTIEKARFTERVGLLPSETIAVVDGSLRLVIGL